MLCDRKVSISERFHESLASVHFGNSLANTHQQLYLGICLKHSGTVDSVGHVMTLYRPFSLQESGGQSWVISHSAYSVSLQYKSLWESTLTGFVVMYKQTFFFLV